mmetsp:Transcript_3285/g.10044  ORF Transcript_3285/g.10044 Transcript_3285/m.10044 type:complete len:1640 (+) Transcript_3285:260-5179(+)
MRVPGMTGQNRHRTRWLGRVGAPLMVTWWCALAVSITTPSASVELEDRDTDVGTRGSGAVDESVERTLPALPAEQEAPTGRSASTGSSTRATLFELSDRQQQKFVRSLQASANVDSTVPPTINNSRINACRTALRTHYARHERLRSNEGFGTDRGFDALSNFSNDHPCDLMTTAHIANFDITLREREYRMIQKHLDQATSAVAQAHSRLVQAERCPEVRSAIHSGCDIVSTTHCGTVVCLQHFVPGTNEIRPGLATHELNPVNKTVTPSRFRRTLPAQIAGGSTSLVGVSFSYSLTITQCAPVLTARLTINGFGTSVSVSVAGQYGPAAIPYLNLNMLARVIPGGGTIVAEILSETGVSAAVNYAVRVSHDGAELRAALLLQLCYELSGLAYGVAWTAGVATEGCCCEVTVFSLGLGINGGGRDPCLVQTRAPSRAPVNSLTRSPVRSPVRATRSPTRGPTAPPTQRGAGVGTCRAQFFPAFPCPAMRRYGDLPTCDDAAFGEFCRRSTYLACDGMHSQLNNCGGIYDVYRKAALGTYQCTFHSHCGSGNYCDNRGDCFPCRVCFQFNNALGGPCPSRCPQPPPPTPRPTSYPSPPPCRSHQTCGYPARGMYCSTSGGIAGGCRPCTLCTNATALGGACPPSCPALRGTPPPTTPIVCSDLAETGLALGGQSATCSQLAPYCNSSQIGQQVRMACRATCRQCVASVNDCCPAIRLSTRRFPALNGVYVRNGAITSRGRHVWQRGPYYIFMISSGYWMVGTNYTTSRGYFITEFYGARCPATPAQRWLHSSAGWVLSPTTSITCCDSCMPVTHPAGMAICGGNYTGNSVNGTTVVGYAAPEHWWTFTAPVRGNYTFSTCGSSFDTYLHVFSRTRGTILGSPVAACDDCGPCLLHAVLTVFLPAGDFFIGVDGYSTQRGNYVLNVTCPRTDAPTSVTPTQVPSNSPTAPTHAPTVAPTTTPTASPSASPTRGPTSAAPTHLPTAIPTLAPSAPTATPTIGPTAVPTTAPTRAPFLPPYFLVLRSYPNRLATCAITADGMCITDGSEDYGNNERCVIRVLRTTRLFATSFATEHHWDFFVIGGTRIGDARVFPPREVNASTIIQWFSDHSITAGGWTICATPPSAAPTRAPTHVPTIRPSAAPTTASPTIQPTTAAPTPTPTRVPTAHPCNDGSHGCDLDTTFCAVDLAEDHGFRCACRSGFESIPNNTTGCVLITASPTDLPSAMPTMAPTAQPTIAPTTAAPTANPTSTPTTASPTTMPTTAPTMEPTSIPTSNPTDVPTTASPTVVPTSSPTLPHCIGGTHNCNLTTTYCAQAPALDDGFTCACRGGFEQIPGNETTCVRITAAPTVTPTANPTVTPTITPTTLSPTALPSGAPTTASPTADPSGAPTAAPTTLSPTLVPSSAPTTALPTSNPTAAPTVPPTNHPSATPSAALTTEFPSPSTLTTTSGGAAGASGGDADAESGRSLEWIIVGIVVLVTVVAGAAFYKFVKCKNNSEENLHNAPAAFDNPVYDGASRMPVKPGAGANSFEVINPLFHKTSMSTAAVTSPGDPVAGASKPPTRDGQLGNTGTASQTDLSGGSAGETPQTSKAHHRPTHGIRDFDSDFEMPSLAPGYLDVAATDVADEVFPGFTFSEEGFSC